MLWESWLRDDKEERFLMISEIIGKHIASKDTGMMSLKIRGGGDHLFKIFLEDGEVTYISFGSAKNNACFGLCDFKEMADGHKFLPGLKLASSNGKNGILTDRLLELIDRDVKHGDSMVPHKEVIRITTDFISAIGPIGKIFIENLFHAMKYRPGDPMPIGHYRRLLKELSTELPEDRKEEFRARSYFN
jgi:hypothetical protein